MSGERKTVWNSFEEAVSRVQRLREIGIWPGIICHRDGTFSLTYNPNFLRKSDL